jgi:signal transduction histidine kinase
MSSSSRTTSAPTAYGRLRDLFFRDIEILLIEDSAVDQLVFCRYVERSHMPFAVTAVSSLEAARSALNENHFDIIVADYYLPDGICLDLGVIFHQYPVIVMTGGGDEKTAVGVMKAGAKDYITKGVGSGALKMLPLTLENVLIRHHAEREREELESRADEMQKMESLGRLAGGIAHDFNNILGSIIGYTELAVEDVDEGSITRKNLQEVLVAAQRASHLVDQILAYTRDGGENKVRVDLVLVFDELMNMLTHSIPDDVDIEVVKQVDSAHVIGNATNLYQVLMNLMTNGIQAMETHGGILRIRLMEIIENLRPMICFEISDQGNGIELEHLERIFEPFFTTKAPGKGTGMGLAAVQGIVEDHNGRIEVSSELGKGSTFTLYIPSILDD